MAQVPSEQEVQEAQLESAMEIDLKRADQQAQGKDFIIPEDGHGPGVIPEEAWKKYKEHDNG